MGAVVERCGRRLGQALLSCLLCFGPASQGVAQPAGAAGSAADLVVGAISLIGVPYRPGGDDPALGLDCSGLVSVVFREVLGMRLPRQAEAMSRVGLAVGRDSLSPGDLVFFNTLGRRNSHVGIYIGDDQFVHAPARRGQVRIERISTEYWRSRFDGARRLLSTEATTPAVLAGPNGPDPADVDDPLGLRRP